MIGHSQNQKQKKQHTDGKQWELVYRLVLTIPPTNFCDHPNETLVALADGKALNPT